MLFDVLLGIHISRKIHLAEHEIKKWDAQYTEKVWTLLELNTILEVSTVIFCGFMVSLLVSILFHVTRKRWEQVKPRQHQSVEGLMRNAHIKAEKTERAAQIAVGQTQIDNLRAEINLLEEKALTTEQKIGECQTKVEMFSSQRQEAEIRSVKISIETQIAALNTEIDNLENEINQLTEKSTAFEKKTRAEKEKIEVLLRQRNERVVGLSKMQSQVNQFLNGWFRFIAHSTDKGTDVSNQIDKVKQIAEETLEQYYQNSPDYFF